jgi:hypothetical protein
VVAMGGLHVRSWRWILMLRFCREEQLLACLGGLWRMHSAVHLAWIQAGGLWLALVFVGGGFRDGYAGVVSFRCRMLLLRSGL